MSYPASIKRLKGQGIIRRAAKHNLREIAAEIGVDRRIDAKRIHLNYVLRGPDTSEEIVSLRNSLVSDAGIKNSEAMQLRGLRFSSLGRSKTKSAHASTLKIAPDGRQSTSKYPS